MSQTKSRGMIYSSNVSDKYKGYGILLECLRKTRGMIYSSNVSNTNRGYGILLECLRQKQGV